MHAVSPPRRWLAIVLGLAAALVFEDVSVSWVAGAPAKAWGVWPLSHMRLATFVALSSLLSAAAWVCATGLPRQYASRRVLFAVLVFGVFLGNGRYIGSNDVASTRILPFVIGREARLCVEGSPQVPLDRAALPYWFVPAGPHVVSRYPVATSLLALPVYLPSIVGSYDALSERTHELERMAAAALALVSVLIVLAIARRWLEETTAFVVAGLYALGTACSTVLSKALWQHTGGAFGFALALFAIFSAQRRWQQLAGLGLGLGIAVAARSTNLAPAACVWLAGAAALGFRTAVGSALLALPLLAAQLGYAHYYFGSFAGTGYGREAVDGWTGTGWLGLLLSPGRGLLIYSPCLAFAALALFRGPGNAAERRVTLLLLAAIASIWLLMGRWWCWWGGGSPGERMTSDVAPLWGVGLALAARQFGGSWPWRASCVYACAVHALIAFARPSGFATEQFYRVMSGPWSLQAYAPISYVLGWLGHAS